MALSKTTQDHDEIKAWAEKRGGRPADVESTETANEAGILRLEFPDAPNANDANLKEIDWEPFFAKFDKSGLAMVYQEVTSEGAESNFCKFVHPENLSDSAKKSVTKSATSKKASTTKPATAKKSAPAKKTAAKKTVPAKASAAKAPVKTAFTKAAAKKTPAKKSTAPAKKTAAKTTPAKKTVAKKSAVPAKKTAAKVAAKKTPAKTIAAKKSPAKKSSGKK